MGGATSIQLRDGGVAEILPRIVRRLEFVQVTPAVAAHAPVSRPAPPERNPPGPSTGDARVLRGGAWTASPGFLRATYRYSSAPDYRDSSVGFRCAKGLG